jgi:flagellar FliL protein
MKVVPRFGRAKSKAGAMAKKAQKPEAEGEDDEAAPPAGKKKLVMIAAAAVLVLGGAGGWFFLGRSSHPPQKGEEKKQVAYVDVQEMTVNLATEPNQDRQRFLKLKVALELKDAKTVPEVQPLLPRVTDVFQVFVRELRPSDLEGSGGIYRLREELLRRVNVAVYPSKVDAVLFKEVIVQ